VNLRTRTVCTTLPELQRGHNLAACLKEEASDACFASAHLLQSGCSAIVAFDLAFKTGKPSNYIFICR